MTIPRPTSAKNLRAQLLNRYPDSDLTLVPHERLARLRSEYPTAPDSYFGFLSDVGWGAVGQGAFMVYSAPVLPMDIFGPDLGEGLRNVLLLADNFAGWHVGFDTTQIGALVTFDHEALIPRLYSGSFDDLVRNELLRIRAN